MKLSKKIDELEKNLENERNELKRIQEGKNINPFVILKNKKEVAKKKKNIQRIQSEIESAKSNNVLLIAIPCLLALLLLMPLMDSNTKQEVISDSQLPNQSDSVSESLEESSDNAKEPVSKMEDVQENENEFDGIIYDLCFTEELVTIRSHSYWNILFDFESGICWEIYNARDHGKNIDPKATKGECLKRDDGFIESSFGNYELDGGTYYRVNIYGDKIPDSNYSGKYEIGKEGSINEAVKKLQKAFDLGRISVQE